MNRLSTILFLLLLPVLTFAQLSDITSVTLSFVPSSGTTVTATATDSGSGLVVDGPINLDESTDYTLSIELFNGGTSINSEVNADAEDLQFFFVPGAGLFTGSISYNDFDSNNLPVGLSSDWTTECTEGGNLAGSFQISLNDLTGIKNANSTITDGSVIFDLTWDVTITDDPNAPECENEEELIDRVTLTFTPVDGGDPIVAMATDPDGPGPLDLETEAITLDESTEYELSITLENTIEGEDITEEIEEEAEDHLFLFAFSEEVFEDPDGDGNVDNRPDPVNYNDQDTNGLPVGLSTNWTSACTPEGDVSGDFRVVLKHQPGIKSETSGFEDGGTDVDITFPITIADDPDAPGCENEEEEIDKVTLTFTPVDGGDPVVAIASDPDGPGPLDLETETITLNESTEYELSITLENTIEGEDITEEIEEEAEDHLFLFAFSEDVFDDPDGDGNIDERSDEINYNDFDTNNLPVGLSTDWTSACTIDGDIEGDFRVVLKHQPGIKSETSGFEDGGTDLDITFPITIVDDADAPECENEEEVIDKVTLIFSPADGSFPTVAVALDPDGPGPLDLEPEDINLQQGTEYTMTIMVENTIEGEDITEEIEEEAEDHQFYFAWSDGLFSNPTGDGNIDTNTDPVNYNDQDANGLPVGLSTQWETTNNTGSGTFRVGLKHQPGIKSETSTFQDGGTDIDITWDVNILVTSTDNLADNQKIILAPNPVREQLSLITENIDLTNTQIIVYNALGQKVKTVARAENLVNVSDLPQGAYTLIIQGEELRATRRFVKL